MLEFTENLRKRSDIYLFMCNHEKDMLSNKDFPSQIKIKHLDGSNFDICNCSWEECKEKIYIWSEHCGYMYFFKDDLQNMEVKTYEWKESRNKFQLLEHIVFNFNYNI